MNTTKPKSINQLIISYLERFPDSDTARLDAEILMAHGLGKSRSWLKAFGDEPVSDEGLARVLPLLERRALGEPVAYILGEWEFFSLPLKVTPDTLIPRPETELLVERALAVLQDQKQPQVLDLGTGTGAIAIAIKQQRPDAEVFAVDESQAALKVAEQNARQHHCSIQWYCGSWYQPLPQAKRFDCIVSNPPYVAQDDPHLNQGDLRFEPLTALTAGDDELADLRHIIEQAPLRLTPNGILMVEHGYNQKESVQALFKKNGFSRIMTHCDYGKQERFTEGYWEQGHLA